MSPARPIRETKTARAQAAAWIGRLQSDERTAQDETGFKAWLDEDKLHQEAFDELTTAWEVAGGLAAEYESLIATPPRRAPLPRVLVAAGMALAVLIGSVLSWRVIDGGAAYATAAGETRRVSFPDGSLVILDSNSAIRVKLKPSRRDFRLARGRAHFEVAKDPHRPFVVTAGDRQVFALGTVFDVARATSSTSVLLLEGRVAVQSTGFLTGQGEPHIMAPGERLILQDDGAAQDDRPNLTKLTAWQSGQAVFDNDSLAAAVAELNRYSRRQIVIVDPAVAKLRVSGVFRADAALDFANSVAGLLPVKVRVDADRILIEGRRPAG